MEWGVNLFILDIRHVLPQTCFAKFSEQPTFINVGCSHHTFCMGRNYFVNYFDFKNVEVNEIRCRRLQSASETYLPPVPN